MLKFFRSIRQNLLNENKTAKYLKYAAGEIILVMIGILLALQVNTWNQNRLLRIEEIDVVKRLLADVEADSSFMDLVWPQLEIKRMSLLSLQTAFAEGTVTDPKSILNDILLGTHRSKVQFEGRRSTYNDLIGSGNLGIIRNPDVRTQIANYYASSMIRSERMEDSKTRYWEYVHQLVPSDASGSPRTLESDLSEEQAHEIVRLVFESPLKNYVMAELNFGTQVQNTLERQKENNEALFAVLKSYQAEIQK